MIVEKTINQVAISLDDIVTKTTMTGFYRNDVLVGREAIDTRVIHPGQDVTGESKKVIRLVAQAHVPTVVDRYNAQKVYDRAVAARRASPTQANIDLEAAAKADLDAKILAYDLFET